MRKLLVGTVVALFAIGSAAPALATTRAETLGEYVSVEATTQDAGYVGSHVSMYQGTNSGRGDGREPNGVPDQDPGLGNNSALVPGNEGGG